MSIDVKRLPFANPTGLIGIEHETNGGQTAATHHKKATAQIGVGVPVWRQCEKYVRFAKLFDTSDMKVSDILAQMVEGNGVSVACKILRCGKGRFLGQTAYRTGGFEADMAENDAKRQVFTAALSAPMSSKLSQKHLKWLIFPNRSHQITAQMSTFPQRSAKLCSLAH